MPSPTQPQPFNGINAATGDYGLTLSADQLVERVFGDDGRARSQQAEYDDAIRAARKSTRRGVRHGVDGSDLSQAGWGVIFAYADLRINAIQEALQPLLKLRAEQAGPLYKVFTGPDAYRPDESKSGFLRRFNVGTGAVDPKKGVPYYLLLIGGPELIPYNFQYQLDVQFAVGRLDFDTVDEFDHYARAVVAAETGALQLARKASFFSVVNPNDSATAATDEYLVQPLLSTLKPKNTTWEINEAREETATRSHLEALLGGDQKPALLFTASHGIEFPPGDPRQEQQQGALLCNEWPGPEAWRGQGALPEEFYFAGDHLASTADPSGMINFHFACFGGGTPQYNDFARRDAPDAETTADQIAARPFIANLPKRLLGHPKGGALAVVSHVDRAWSYSYRQGKTSQTTVFESALMRLFQGQPLGWALEYFNSRYAELAADLNNEIDRRQRGTGLEAFELASLWTENNDARNYVLLGDPAVRLAVGGTTEASRERPVTIQLMADGRPATVSAEDWEQTPISVRNTLGTALHQVETLSAQLQAATSPKRVMRGGQRRSATTRGGTTRGGRRGS